MQYVVDLHLHSKYSRAVSPKMTLPMMATVAEQKGLDILTASDFTHPLWFAEIEALLEEAGDGIYKLKPEHDPTHTKKTLFILSTEISSIYKHGNKLRRIHNLVFVPNLVTAKRLNQELTKRGCNLTADGRPIVGLSSKELLELILSLDERCLLIPCHIWTPHFGIYGSASGFDSLHEAFGELDKYVYGIETGLSSDPDMNWQVPELMNRTILSFSDAHSAPKMSREATVMELSSPTYENIRKAIMRLSVIASNAKQSKEEGIAASSSTPRNDENKILYTLEFYPEEGKYHFSGHRNCKVVYTPEDVQTKGVVCPVCGRGLTEGVFMRVEQLSDPKLFGRAVHRFDAHGVKWYTDTLHVQPPYVKLVPLLEIVAESLHSTVASQKSQKLFAALCSEFTSELTVLLKTNLTEIERLAGWKIAESIQKVRRGEIAIDPGFDGVFGKVSIWRDEEERQKMVEKAPQLRLDL